MRTMDGLDGLKDLRHQPGCPQGSPWPGWAHTSARAEPAPGSCYVSASQQFWHRSSATRSSRCHKDWVFSNASPKFPIPSVADFFIWSQKEPEPPNSPNHPSALLCLAQAAKRGGFVRLRGPCERSREENLAKKHICTYSEMLLEGTMGIYYCSASVSHC